MKKHVRRALTGVAIVVLLLLVSLATGLNAIVRSAVTTFGPKLTGTTVKLEKVRLSPFTGKGRIQGLEVGNPEGYQTPAAIKLGAVEIHLRPASLFSSLVVIERIFVDSPEITYELGLGESNIGRILKNVEGVAAASEPAAAAPAGPERPAKKVRIDDLLIRNGRIRVSSKLLQGAAAAIPLPEIHLTDIGKASGGAPLGETLSKVLAEVVKTAGGAARDGGKLIGEGAAAVGESGVQGAKAVGAAAAKGVSGVVQGLGGLLGGDRAADKPAQK